MKNLIAIVIIMILFVLEGKSQDVKVGGSYRTSKTNSNTPGGWSRNMQTTMYCGNNPESWVRGSVICDKQNGIAIFTIQLESDSNLGGPKGQVIATFFDSNKNAIAKATTTEIGMKGKTGGKAVRRNFSSEVQLPKEVAGKIDSIYLTAKCTGSVDRFGTVTAKDAFEIALALYGL